MSNPLNAVSGGPFITGPAFQKGTLVYAATVNVADPAGLADLNLSMLSIDAAGRLRCLITPASGAVFSVTPSPLVDGIGNTGRAVAPLAGAAIVTVAAPPAGTYDIQVFAAYDAGAPAAAEINNMEFREGAAVVSVLQVLAVVSVYGPARVFRRVLDGATAVSVNAVAAGTAGVGYNAELVLTRIG